MTVRTRLCAQCNRQFSYQVGVGKDRLFCGQKCKTENVIAKRKVQCAKLQCSVHDCHKPPRAAGSAYCEMHYARMYQRGTVEPRVLKAKIDHSHGYILVREPSHPLCTQGQPYVYEHRKVFYDANGAGPFRCHVCTAPVTWADMHVDHLDDDPTNNDIDNLRPACPTCNQWRGREKRARSAEPRASLSQRSARLSVSRSGLERWGCRWTTLNRRIRNGGEAELALSEPGGSTGRKSARARADAKGMPV